MPFKEKLDDFAGAIGAAGTSAPDRYAPSSYWTYETHMTDLKELWAEIRPQLKRDVDKAQFIDNKLQEMFAAFEAGQKEKGQDAAWAIYNLEVKKLR